MSADILTYKQRKAKKPHKCDLCGKSILPGIEYIYTSYSYDGSIHDSRFHIHCDAMASAVLATGDFDEYNYDDIAYWLWEIICEEKCSSEQREECDLSDTFSCEICQSKMLTSTILEAARQSVRISDPQ